MESLCHFVLEMSDSDFGDSHLILTAEDCLQNEMLTSLADEGARQFYSPPQGQVYP